MIEVTKTHLRQQRSYEEAVLAEQPADYQTLYIRREIFPDGTFEEFAYRGPSDEVQSLVKRAFDVNLEEVDKLLRAGKSFEEALTELGK
jgi:hypothetical protein